MKISAGKVVTMQYVLTNTAGEILDQSAPNEPLTYLHGEGQIVPGLEKQIEGMGKGDSKDKIVIAPDEAYGEFRDELKTMVDRKQFQNAGDIQPGMQFVGQSADGQRRPFTVLSVHPDTIELDGNHPLAGQTLTFKIAIEDVREATQEELQHGHVHGPGGHHH